MVEFITDAKAIRVKNDDKGAAEIQARNVADLTRLGFQPVQTREELENIFAMGQGSYIVVRPDERDRNITLRLQPQGIEGELCRSLKADISVIGESTYTSNRAAARLEKDVAGDVHYKAGIDFRVAVVQPANLDGLKVFAGVNTPGGVIPLRGKCYWSNRVEAALERELGSPSFVEGLDVSSGSLMTGQVNRQYVEDALNSPTAYMAICGDKATKMLQHILNITQE